MKFITAPSILSADFSCLEKEIRKVESLSNSWLHLDIMDGHFVPNITFGPCVINSIRKVTNLFFDAHLMVDHPERFIDIFKNAGVNSITFQIESTHFPLRLVNEIKNAGIKAGVSLNPATDLNSIKSVLGYVDLVLVMSVEPGFSGQKFIPFSLNKIQELKEFRKRNNLSFLISVDGGINNNTAEAVIKSGADVLVMGSFFFKNNFDDIKSFLERLWKK